MSGTERFQRAGRAALALLRRNRGFVLALAIPAILLALFYACRGNRIWMNGFVRVVSGPIKRGLGAFCDLFPFSLAEWLIYGAVFALLGFLARTVWLAVRLHGPEQRKRLCRRGAGLLCTALGIYASFCGLWGAEYYADGFVEKSGLRVEPVTVEELYQTAARFADQASAYGALVERDGDGRFTADRKSIFRDAKGVYDAAASPEAFPFLAGPERRPKPLVWSELLSWLNLTGFFFPFTGEANLNNHSPLAALPATIAHELAHQRGVAPEQEANFAAIAACISCGDNNYAYSGYLLGYVHLGNALYAADRELWERAASRLTEEVWRDLEADSQYWDKYETVVAAVSSGVNDGMLKSNGQELGTKSYGAVVDLLVAYAKTQPLLYGNSPARAGK